MKPTSNVVLRVELLVGPVDADTVEMPPVRQLSVEDWVEKTPIYNKNTHFVRKKTRRFIEIKNEEKL